MNLPSIKLGRLAIGSGHPPVIVAEMSGNHNQSLERALAIVDAAAASGCHALKLQTYTPDTMTIDVKTGQFLIDDDTSLWKGDTLYELYQKAFTPWEWHKPLLERAHELGMLAFSTPFDESAVDFLETLNVPLYKIASFENVDLPLLRRVGKTGKPIVLSTGMASLAELSEAIETIRSTGNNQIVLLKCTSSYPATPENSNVRTIPHMSELFRVPVGLSDHTPGIGAAVAAVALGAVMIEKHFTLSRAEGGVDAAFSLEPAEMKLLVNESQAAFQALGDISYGQIKAEEKSLRFRRSLFVVRDVEVGETFSEKNVRIIRPGHGLSPKYLDQVLGRVAKNAIKRGTPMNWNLLGPG